MIRRPSLIAGCAFVLGMASCTRPAAVPSPPPTTVSVCYPLEKEITYHSDFTGRTAAVDAVDVRAHVWGYLDKVNFTEGDLVKKDDILFEIDPRTYQAQLDQAKADLDSKEAIVVKTQAIYSRTANLLKARAASEEDLDNAKGDWLVAKANVVLAKANLRTAELNLGFTKVKAQISGRIAKYNVTVGNIVQSGDQGGGTLLTTIVSVDPIYVNFDVDERTVLNAERLAREGKATSTRNSVVPVHMGLGNESDFSHQGVINYAGNQINPTTGTLPVRGVFPNKDGMLTPGLFVRVRVPVGKPHKAMLVTDRAIDSDQGQKIVYTVNEKNEVVVQPVELGPLEGGLRVIETGLKPGDRVIVNGLQQVRPGAIVDPKLVDMPVNPATRRQVVVEKK
jgi:RND family efflux transporter MFP subunit